MDRMHHHRNILRFVGWFFLANSLFFCVLGYGYLRAILSSPSLFINSLADYSGAIGKLFIVTFALVNYLSYMMLLGFIPALLVFLLALLVPSRRFIFLISVLIATLALMVLIINNCIYSMFKFHLNGAVYDLLFNGQWYDVFDFSQQEYIDASLILMFLVLLESGTAYFVWHKIVLPKAWRVGRSVALFWFGGFLFSYLALLLSIAQNNNLLSQQTPNLPFYNQFIVMLIPDKNAEDILYRYSEEHFSQPLFSNDPVNYPLHALSCTKPANPPNIILIMVDSLRFDSLNSNAMPFLNRFAGRSWQFTHYLSGGNSTQPGVFSLFYSIPGSYWTAMLKQSKAPVFLQILRQYGYDFKVLWSTGMTSPPFGKVIYSETKDISLTGAPGDDIGNRDRYVSREAIKFLSEHQGQKPFFLNLFYNAPHGYCREQSYPIPYQPAIAACSRVAMTNDVDPLPYYNRYLNAVRFIDGELTTLLASIEQWGYLDNSIVIITADHGQEFNDSKQNYWGHAGNFTNAQVQVPFIIHWPYQSPKVFHYLTSSYDVVPTLLEKVFHCHNPVIDYSIGQNLLKKQGRLPFVLAGSYSNMGIIESDRLTTLRTSGSVVITDVHAKPEFNIKPGMSALKKALALMRLYYAK